MKLTKIIAIATIISSALTLTGCFDSKDKASFKTTEYVCKTVNATKAEQTFHVLPYTGEVKGVRQFDTMKKSSNYKSYELYSDMSESPVCDISDICTVRTFEIKSVNTKTKDEGPSIKLTEKAHQRDELKIEYTSNIIDSGYCQLVSK